MSRESSMSMFVVHYGMERSEDAAKGDFESVLGYTRRMNIAKLLASEFTVNRAEIVGSSLVIPVRVKSDNEVRDFFTLGFHTPQEVYLSALTDHTSETSGALHT